MSKRKVYSFEGEKFEVKWDSGLCIHAGECVRADSDLFELSRKPWAQPDLVEEGDVDRIVKRCPTGAIAYSSKDGSTSESPEPENTVTVSPNGPLYVRGDLQVEGIEPTEGAVEFRVALCRCGHSKNKPFCDNSHIKAEFKDSGAVGREGPGLEEVGGPLTITPRPNGSLLLKGNVSIRSGSGSVRWQGKKVSLCRCGLSKSMPFCDGAHKAGGFEADGA